MGILELEPNQADSEPFPAHHYEDKYAFEDIYPVEIKIVKEIISNRPNGKCKPNPTIFRRLITKENRLKED